MRVAPRWHRHGPRPPLPVPGSPSPARLGPRGATWQHPGVPALPWSPSPCSDEDERLATLRDVNMIKLESGNPPLQLGKAVCNSADYPLVK